MVVKHRKTGEVVKLSNDWKVVPEDHWQDVSEECDEAFDGGIGLNDHQLFSPCKHGYRLHKRRIYHGPYCKDLGPNFGFFVEHKEDG